MYYVQVNRSLSPTQLKDIHFLMEELGFRICRVKCDEQKPSYAKCISTGRKCDGYTNPAPFPGRENGVVPAERDRGNAKDFDYARVNSPSFDTPGDRNEQRSFRYFRSRSVQDISGYFDSEFWEHRL